MGHAEMPQPPDEPGPPLRTDETQALDRSQLVAVLQLATSAVIARDRQGRYVFANDAAARMLGLKDAAAVRGIGPQQLAFNWHVTTLDGQQVAPEDLPGARAMRGEPAQEYALKYHFRPPEGSGKTGIEHEVVVLAAPLRDESGAVTHAVSLIRDVTEAKRKDRDLRASEEKYRKLVELCPDAIALHVAGKVVYVNREGQRMLGATDAAQVIGRSAIDFVHPTFRPLVAQRMRDAAEYQREQPLMEERFVGLDGREIDVEVASIPYDHEGQPGTQVVFRDITARKQAEADLLRARKLESLALLAGGIAHDFNNLMTVVLANLTLARLELKDGSRGYQRVVATEKAALRARDLTQQLLTFAKGGAPVCQPVDVAAAAREAASFALAGSQTKLELQVEGPVVVAHADPGQLGQVLQNLLINARQAMQVEGTVYMTVDCVAIGAPQPDLPLPPGRYVQFRVRDTGHGIAAEHLAKIFDPFYTTRHFGTGLGLATTHAIVQRHGGWISVASKPGDTEFRVWLPASDQPAAPLASTAPAQENGDGRGRVLVMDDDPLMRETAEAVVNALGYDCVAAADGAEAVARYREALDHGARFDAVLLDLTVPVGMGGRQAMVELRALDREVQAIVSSGYSNDAAMAAYADLGFAGVVQKPYTVAEISAVLRRVIGR
jgi:PAS domain S-box-containing protein